MHTRSECLRLPRDALQVTLDDDLLVVASTYPVGADAQAALEELAAEFGFELLARFPASPSP